MGEEVGAGGGTLSAASADSGPVLGLFFFSSPCSSEAAQAAFEPFLSPSLSQFDISERSLTLPERCRDAPCVCVNEATVSSVPAGAPPTLRPGRAAAPRAAKRKKTNKTS